MGDGLAEWIITTPGGAQLLLQMAYFDRGRQPVLMEVGPRPRRRDRQQGRRPGRTRSRFPYTGTTGQAAEGYEAAGHQLRLASSAARAAEVPIAAIVKAAGVTR